MLSPFPIKVILPTASMICFFFAGKSVIEITIVSPTIKLQCSEVGLQFIVADVELKLG